MSATRKARAAAPDSAQSDDHPAHYGPIFQAAVLDQARRNGLLTGEKSEHVSFRAHPALVEEAKRKTGITSTSELGILALAALTGPDPVVEYMRKNRGRLGRDHTLDY